MEKKDALQRLSTALETIPKIRNMNAGCYEFLDWMKYTKESIRYIFGENSSHLSEFEGISFSPTLHSADIADSDLHRWFTRGLDSAEVVLASMRDEIEERWTDDKRGKPGSGEDFSI